jgi:hypothetical protein
MEGSLELCFNFETKACTPMFPRLWKKFGSSPGAASLPADWPPRFG